ncbi:hypothetical protein BDB00DRAFT_788643 [Zychaea mexicana]|uniref:uncharacterized protein n=1 Tax=Zychaea mexicana TaxID=64656 RepID=UPI0022FDC66D|nr:uncharacterized protein BDB00DRAFT_788643 [Zychaea mexicana]KAI9492656.1 hypothetical protein BDB00DRAFT_788643 [Zychaea mexicana]
MTKRSTRQQTRKVKRRAIAHDSDDDGDIGNDKTSNHSNNNDNNPSNDNDYTWQKLLDSTELAFSQGDYSNTVHNASLATDELFKTVHTQVLALRAASYGMVGKFDLALQDALKIIDYAPTLSKGYLCAGELYRMQGKPLRAVEIYNKCLDIVGKQDKGYRELLQHREMAKEQHNRRIDFVSLLPLEIISDVITRLSTNTRSMCLCVSKGWRRKITKCPDVWSELAVLDFENWVEPSAVYTMLALTNNHVKELTVECPDKDRLYNTIIREMLKGGFKRLRSFSLSPYSSLSMHPDIDTSLIPMALCRLDNALVDLSLDFSEHSNPPSLAALIHACPQLIRLKYSSESWQLLRNKQDLLPENCNLIELDINTGSEYFDASEAEIILKRCPKLRSLYLDRYLEQELIPIVMQHCSKLESFVFNKYDGFQAQLDRWKLVDGSNKTTPGVLSRLHLCNPHYFISAEDIVRVLRCGNNTLKELYCAFDYTDSMVNDFSYPRLSLPRLTVFHTSAGGSRAQNVIASIIRQSPAIEEFDLHVYNKQIEPAIFIALEGLPRLRFLEIGADDVDDEMQAIGITEFFGRQATLSSRRNRLEELHLHRVSLTNAHLTALASMKTLQKISLDECIQAASVQEFNSFIERLGLLPSLQTIKLGNIDYVTDMTLEKLAGSKSLKELELWDLEEISERGIRGLITNAKSLQNLWLKRCTPISVALQAYAEGNLKHFKIE